MTLQEEQIAERRIPRGRSTTDVEALAQQQGVKPVTDFDRLLGDFWPEEETADDFNAAVERWRANDL